MSENNDSKYRIALELARIIQGYEHPDNSAPKGEEREYWLRLYHQCVVAAEGWDINEVVGLVKNRERG